MKIKFNSDDEIPLNKAMEIPIMTIAIRDIFLENNKFYPQVFLDERLYKIENFLIMIELTFLLELMLIKQVHHESIMFVTNSIS